MGLFNKIKNVLFEEEEIEIPVYTKEPIANKPTMADKIDKIKKTSKPDTYEPPVIKKPDNTLTSRERRHENILVEDSERETFRSEPTFQFPAFDEKEFEEPKKVVKQKAQEKPVTKPKRNSKKLDFGRFDKKEQKVIEEKRFVPSPVISPVYGVLDKNYTKVQYRPVADEKTVDFDRIRAKAYGTTEETLEQEIERTIQTPKREFYKEEEKSIDELLTDVVDDTIEEANETFTPDTQESKSKEPDLDDTLESDLFNLIDSMYADRKDEE